MDNTPLLPMLAMVALSGANLLLKKFSSSNHFFRTGLGQFLFALVTGVVGTVLHTAQMHGFHKIAIAYAVTGFLTSLFATASTERPGGGDVLKVLALLALPLGLSGCAFGKCELNHLPQTLQPLLVAAIALAAQPSGYVQDLVRLAENEVPGQIDCIAEAIVGQKIPASTMPSMSDVAMTDVRAHFREYLRERRAAGVKISCASQN